MGIYWRYKNNPGGFRALVELLESTPPTRRKKMIDAGLAEDSWYTMTALKFVLSFDDILKLPDMELAEVTAAAPPHIVAYAIRELPDDQRERFVRCSSPHTASEIKLMLDARIGPRDICGARMKLISVTRELERKGLIRTKKIPATAQAA